ncbi:MAG: hypothetical protein CME71_02075 [Halobacteriovorax sp.]|nr:hypothetical protein [Halobacteriovorax sp.]
MKIKDIEFGNISSEVERLIDQGVYITRVFQDIFNIQDFLNKGKVLILGRKGTGKTFIKEYIDVEPRYNVFSCKISFKLKDLEVVIQEIGKLSDVREIDLWKWIFLCNLAELMMKDKSLDIIHENSKACAAIESFLKTHRGYIEPNSFALKEQVTRYSTTINMNFLKRAWMAVFKKDIAFKEERASFVKVIPYLEKMLIEIIQSSHSDRNKYFIFVDDIDDDYSGDEDQNKSIVDLINAAKDLFLRFGSEGVFFCPSILLRGDILSKLSYQIDTRKLNEDLAFKIKWYDHQTYRDNDSEVPLKNLMSKRIEYSYTKNGLTLLPKDLGQADYWDLLFIDWDDEKESFKYIADNTLYRPRDFITIFNIIKRQDGNSKSIKKSMVNKALGEYSQKVIEEWKFELKVFFKEFEIESIIKYLSDISGPFEGKSLLKLVPRLSDDVVNILYEYGLICIYENERMFWKYREGFNDPAPEPHSTFLPHFCFKNASRKPKRFSF